MIAGLVESLDRIGHGETAAVLDAGMRDAVDEGVASYDGLLAYDGDGDGPRGAHFVIESMGFNVYSAEYAEACAVADRTGAEPVDGEGNVMVAPFGAISDDERPSALGDLRSALSGAGDEHQARGLLSENMCYVSALHG